MDTLLIIAQETLGYGKKYTWNTRNNTYIHTYIQTQNDNASWLVAFQLGSNQ